jgi:hypothetical protein
MNSPGEPSGEGKSKSSSSNKPHAFVIMPIGSEGSEAHAYSRALYVDYIRPTLESAGFEVSRADDSALSGAITKDIIHKLANSDVVVADLTATNPNVFYEVGVRHALRRSGTVLIVDEGRTPDIPFDISAYRAILFRGDLPGAAELQRKLRATLEEITRAAVEHRDNPVHDWLPVLPVNAVVASTGTEAGALREELAEAQRRLRDFERRLGETPRPEADQETPISILGRALRDAKDGNLAPDLIRDAEHAAGASDRERFLTVVHKIFERELLLEPDQFTRLAVHATRLGMRDVSRAIYDEATVAHPGNTEVRKRRLMGLTHSIAADDRKLARSEIMTQVGLEITKDGTVVVPSSLDGESLGLIAVMLDAFHEDGLNSDALAITSALVERFKNYTTVARNHARALERAGEPAEAAMEWFVKAVKCPDVEDVSASFLAATLSAHDRDVDALEAFCFSALLAPGDGEPFARLATGTAYALESRLTGSDRSDRPLPEEVAVDTVQVAILAACSCDLLLQEGLDRCVRAAQQAELASDFIAAAFALRTPSANGDEDSPLRMKLADRYAFVSGLHELLKSPLTATGIGASDHGPALVEG